MLGFGVSRGVSGVDCEWGGDYYCSYVLYVPLFSSLLILTKGYWLVVNTGDDAGNKYDASPAALAHNQHSESLLLTSTLTTRAFENTCAVIFANVSAGPGSGDRYMGLSRAVLPVVGVVGSMGDEEGVMVVGMDMGVVRVAEECYRVRGDLGGEGWYYVYRHSLR